MQNYDKLIQQSHENVRVLSEKLKSFEELHKEIRALVQQPKEIVQKFDNRFQEIAQFTEKYTNTLGVAAKIYLDGNNDLFVSKLEDVQKMLDVFDEKNKNIQTEINKLEEQVTRLSAINLEEHFNRHQNKLSEIFNAVNSINITLSNLTQILTSITQSLSNIQNKIETTCQATARQISDCKNDISNHLNQQDEQTKNRFGKIENQLSELERQNAVLKKEIETGRIIQICGITVILIGIALILYL
jgi:predicted  nucleic acid-binding Zn-ribbon protein